MQALLLTERSWHEETGATGLGYLGPAYVQCQRWTKHFRHCRATAEVCCRHPACCFPPLYERGTQWSPASPSHWGGRSTNLSKGARARGEVRLLDLTAWGERGSVKPPQQLLGKKVLGREGDGTRAHTHTRAHTELVALGLLRKRDPLGPSSLGQWPHAFRAARSCSCLCLTSVSSTYGGEYLGALEKVTLCMHVLSIFLMHLRRQR